MTGCSPVDLRSQVCRPYSVPAPINANAVRRLEVWETKELLSPEADGYITRSHSV